MSSFQYNLKLAASLIGSGAVLFAIAPMITLRMDAAANAVTWGDVGEGLRNAVNGIAPRPARADAPGETPLPVPNTPSPVGRTDTENASPCVVPPQVANAVQAPKPVAALDNYKDPKTKILMNTRPGNRMFSLLDRVGYPQRWNSKTRTDYFDTQDGAIAVKSDNSDRVVSINFVR